MSPAARFRALPLRSRLALLVAVAVAVAVAAVAAVAWVMVRTQLRDQLDRSLMSTNVSAQVARTLREGCVVQPPKPTQQIAGNLNATVQIVLSDGTRCWVGGQPDLPVTGTDRQVAADEQAKPVLHDVTTPDGVDMRVYTLQANPAGPAFGVSIAKPLGDVEKPCPRWPGCCCWSAASEWSAPGPPGCGWPGRGCGRWTN